MISYEPLWKTMHQKGITQYTLIQKFNVNTATIYRLRQGGHISTQTLDDLCNILDCEVQDVLVHIKNKKGL